MKLTMNYLGQPAFIRLESTTEGTLVQAAGSRAEVSFPGFYPRQFYLRTGRFEQECVLRYTTDKSPKDWRMSQSSVLSLYPPMLTANTRYHQLSLCLFVDTLLF